MLSDIPEKIQEAKVFEPIVIVDHHGGIFHLEIQKMSELAPNTPNIFFDLFDGLQQTLFIFSRRIADQARGSTHERIRRMARPLHVEQHHDGN